MGKRKVTAVLVILTTGQLAWADWADCAAGFVGSASRACLDCAVTDLPPVPAAVSPHLTRVASDTWSGTAASQTSVFLDAGLGFVGRFSWADSGGARVHDVSPGSVVGTLAESHDVVELPPPPSGSTLTLSGLLSLATLQVARSARGVRLAGVVHGSHLPHWYYHNASEVGQNTLLDSCFRASLLRSDCLLVAIALDRHSTDFGQADAEFNAESAEYALLMQAPRSPPAQWYPSCIRRSSQL